jgi:acetyl esterase/lipase
VWSHELRVGNNVIPLATDGSFNYKFYLNDIGCYTLQHENKTLQLCIKPGDSLHLNLDGVGVNITGSSGELNTSLQEHVKIFKRNIAFLDDNNKAIFSQQPSAFNKIIDSLKLSEITSLHKFIAENNGLSNALISKLQLDIIYRSKFYQLLYPHNYNRHTGKLAAVKRNYFANITKGSFDHPELLSSDAFLRYVNFYLDIQAAGKYKFQNLESGPVERINSRYQAIMHLPVSSKVRDYFIGDHFKISLDNYSIKDLSKCFSLFEKDCKNEAIRGQIRNLYKAGLERRTEPGNIKIYRQVDGVELEAHIFYPAGFDGKDKRPAYLFFHGGGWATGMPEWGYGNCKRFASKGMVAVSFEYRLRNVHGTHIEEAVGDALAAVAWVRGQAGELGVDTTKIVAAGFSSGAHLAACTAMMNNTAYFENSQKFSCRPNAAILQSAAYSVAGRDALNAKTAPELLSPLYVAQGSVVPILMLHGKDDNIVNYSEFEQFVKKMTLLGNDFTYKSFEGRGHFFYDPGSVKIVEEMSDQFLVSHGFLEQ